MPGKCYLLHFCFTRKSMQQKIKLALNPFFPVLFAIIFFDYQLINLPKLLFSTLSEH